MLTPEYQTKSKAPGSLPPDAYETATDKPVTAAAGDLLELLATKLELAADVTVDDIRPDIAVETQ
jgi:hypothetical protein